MASCLRSAPRLNSRHVWSSLARICCRASADRGSELESSVCMCSMAVLNGPCTETLKVEQCAMQQPMCQSSTRLCMLAFCCLWVHAAARRLLAAEQFYQSAQCVCSCIPAPTNSRSPCIHPIIWRLCRHHTAMSVFDWPEEQITD